MMFTPKSLAKAVVALDEHERQVFDILVEALSQLKEEDTIISKQKRTRKVKAAAKDPNKPKRKYTRKAKPDLDEKFPKNEDQGTEKQQESNDAA